MRLGGARAQAWAHLQQVLQLHGAAAVLAVQEGLALRLQGAAERAQGAGAARLGVGGHLRGAGRCEGGA